MSGWLIDEEPEAFKPWTLADIYNDLGSKTDVAKALDVNIYRMQRWVTRRERINSPHPIRRIGHVDIYSIQEWRDWYEAWLDRKRVGRRPDSKWVNATPYGHGTPFFTHKGN